MRVPLATVFGLVVGVVSSVAVHAEGYLTFTGSTVGGPTWQRPQGEGPVVDPFTVHYRSDSFVLPASADCTIYSVQGFDGTLHLYHGSFIRTTPLVNLVDGDDDGELGVGTSRIPHNLDQPWIALPAGLYYLVTSGFQSDDVGAYQNLIQCDASVQPLQGPCYFNGVPRERQVCLQDRFAVKIDNISNHPTDGRGTPVRFGSNDSAFFWFYNDSNFEVMVKVLNACAFDGHWWVFIAGTTNQAHRIQVGDANHPSVVRTYNRSLGPPAPAITDTAAFACP